MAKKKIDRIIEAVLFASDKPVSAPVLAQVAEVPAKQIEKTIAEINDRMRESGSSIAIRQIAGGYEFLTLSEYAPYIKKLYRNRFMARLSKPALEVLSIIAYKQPITKQEVEVIRGVNSDGVYHTLLERKLIKIAGRKETPGRPLMYGTSRDFLQYLGINSLEDLPKIDEIKSILEKDEFVEKWDERIETARGQARFEFGEEEGISAEQRLIEKKSDFSEEAAGDGQEDEGSGADNRGAGGDETGDEPEINLSSEAGEERAESAGPAVEGEEGREEDEVSGRKKGESGNETEEESETTGSEEEGKEDDDVDEEEEDDDEEFDDDDEDEDKEENDDDKKP